MICPAPFAKIFRFRRRANHLYRLAHPVPTRGAFRERQERGAGCSGRDGFALTSEACCGRQSRVVLAPRRWCQVCGAIHGRRWLTSPAHRGDHGVTVKTIARGMPGDSGEPVVTTLVCLFYYLHARLRVHRAPGISCALFIGGMNDVCTTRAKSRRGNAESCSSARLLGSIAGVSGILGRPVKPGDDIGGLFEN